MLGHVDTARRLDFCENKRDYFIKVSYLSVFKPQRRRFPAKLFDLEWRNLFDEYHRSPSFAERGGVRWRRDGRSVSDDHTAAVRRKSTDASRYDDRPWNRRDSSCESTLRTRAFPSSLPVELEVKLSKRTGNGTGQFQISRTDGTGHASGVVVELLRPFCCLNSVGRLVGSG